MTTLDITVTTSDYDCSESNDTTWAVNGWDSDGDRVGERSGNRDDIGVIFVGINIPQGAVISTAYVQGYHNFNAGGNPPITIKGIAENSPGIFDATHRPSQRTKTTATVSQTCPNGVGGYVSFAEIKTIVQELIGRVGWVSGQNMGFVIEENASPADYRSQFGDYFWDAAKAWKFHVEFSFKRPGPPKFQAVNRASTY